jgi:hypothetical protein
MAPTAEHPKRRTWGEATLGARTGEGNMDQLLVALFHRHVASVFDRQLRLADFLEREADGEPWQYTISTATLAFGERVVFSALDLGSHADPDDSWLWSWSHPQLNLTPANRELGAAVRRIGGGLGIPAFEADGQFSCLEILGGELCPDAAHVFATVVAGELGFDAYYTMPFATGRMAAVIRDDRFRVPESNPVARILSVFPQVISAFSITDHRAAFVAYAEAYGLAVDDRPHSVSLLVNGREHLNAGFDSLGRLTEMTAQVNGNK